MPDAVPTPHDEYQARLAAREATVASESQADGRFAMARGAVFLGGIVLAIAAWSSTAVSAGWLLLPIAVFIGLAVAHSRTAARLDAARRAVAHYRQALDRLADRWPGIGPAGERYVDPDHLYAGDLDVFGRGSLFQLMCRARTRPGEDTLAAWLSAGAGLDTLRHRHAAIGELREMLDLRERMALLDAAVHDDLDQKRLLQWVREPSRTISGPARGVAVVLSLLGIAALVAWLGFDAGIAWLMGALIAILAFTFSLRNRIHAVADHVSSAESGIGILSQVLEVIERERFDADLLRGLRAKLNTEGAPPSTRIARLHSLVSMLETAIRNQFFAPIAFLLCLHLHLVHAIESWRIRFGSAIPDWLDAVGEFEAISALAGYAYEHPNDPLPDFVGDGPVFEGTGLGHPLLPADHCVRNDVKLGAEPSLVLVSGSNMSGKSTLLRTVGTNVVLALAGAPVHATGLRLSPVVLGSAMRISDSLQEGRSLFYAVIGRLKRVVEQAGGEIPLLFLLDEILQGTNSHDRRIGAEGVIRKLVERGAIGFVTTHDLALTEIVASFGSKAINVHFEDHLIDGKMTFDYRLRPGIVERSNALELMRMMGLEV